MSSVVGLPDVFRHTPISVTVAPPLSVMFPPAQLSAALMIEGEVVLIVGKAALVVKLTSFP